MLKREFPLFGSAAEHERVTTFQAGDGFAGEGVFQDQIKDLGLNRILFAFVLADVDELGVGLSEGENVWANEPIIEDDIDLAEKARGFKSEEFGIAGTCADEIKFASTICS